ncbi:MAG: hypothetical protein JNJ90_10065 [Saprospiraceae bacterium]|jgi:hypothetical protein|nr:hypothetical protein [Saprospiraceae bacterium]
MKKIALLAVVALSIICCEKEEVWPFFQTWKGPQNYGQVHAIRNGEIWEASASGHFFSTSDPHHCAISFTAFYPDSILSVVAESFGFSNVPVAVGSYKIHLSEVLSPAWYDSLRCLYVLKHDDVVITEYRPDPNVESNRVWVDAIDTVAGTISGRFDVTLLKDPDDTRTKFPRTIRFQNGTFTARHWP